MSEAVEVAAPLDPRAFTESLPGKRVAAGALFVDDWAERILLVKPIRKPYWDLPGGIVEHNESPRAAAEREIKEELGVPILLGKLLVVDYFPDRPDGATEALMFVFDGGHPPPWALDSQIQLQADELEAWGWFALDEVQKLTLLAPALRRRISAAWDARRAGVTLYMEDGVS